MNDGLKETAQNRNWWDGVSEFNWTLVIGEATKVPSTKLATPKERYDSGKQLLQTLASEGESFSKRKSYLDDVAAKKIVDSYIIHSTSF